MMGVGWLLRRFALVKAGAVLLFLCSWQPVAWLATASLELPYRSDLPPRAVDPQAIVVLTASALSPNASRPEAVEGLSAYQRGVYAAWLFHHRYAVPVLTCGGIFHIGSPSLAKLMAAQLERRGVSPVWTENHSGSTAQNALYGAAVLRARGANRILLVTEAFHMPRAERCFRKQGLTVFPAPCSFRTMEDLSKTEWLLCSLRAMSWTEEAIHEWIGLAWYWATGRI